MFIPFNETLMDELVKKHNGLNRKIKTLNKEIPKLKKIEEKYTGQKGRIRKDDTQRKKDNNHKIELKKELSEKKPYGKNTKKSYKRMIN